MTGLADLIPEGWQRVQFREAMAASRQARAAGRCPNRARHWRIVPRTVGMRAPVCTECGSPNPKPLKDWEWAEVLDWATDHNVGDHIRTAIEARRAEASR